MIDHDPKRQDHAIRMIVDVLQMRDPEMTGTHTLKHQIAAALDSYMGAVVELVLAGTLNMDQGEELKEIVQRIAHEVHGPETPA